ncbi:unnamed protein product [Laminaria digitata]
MRGRGTQIGGGTDDDSSASVTQSCRRFAFPRSRFRGFRGSPGRRASRKGDSGRGAGRQAVDIGKGGTAEGLRGQNGNPKRVEVLAVSQQLPRRVPEANVRTGERQGGVPPDLPGRVLHLLRAVHLHRHAKQVTFVLHRHAEQVTLLYSIVCKRLPSRAKGARSQAGCTV